MPLLFLQVRMGIFSFHRSITFLFAVIVVCFTSTLGLAQPTPGAASHPKVGLVLEGGGALGLAHIGVIQWLEEHRIPVSYIAGTSMGGLVGGIYATGRHARGVRGVVGGIDWDGVIGGGVWFWRVSFSDTTGAPAVTEDI